MEERQDPLKVKLDAMEATARRAKELAQKARRQIEEERAAAEAAKAKPDETGSAQGA